MGIKYWIAGSGSQDFMDTNNWSATPGGVGGAGAPTAGDVLHVGVTASSSNIDTNLAWTGGAGTLNVYPGFTGTIGTSSTPLDLNASALVYKGNATFASFSDVTDVTINTPSNGQIMLSSTDFDTADITVINGNVYFDGSAINVGKTGTVEFHGGVVELAAENSGSAVNFEAWGGCKITCARTVGTVKLTGAGTQLRTTGTKTALRVDTAEFALYLINSTGTITDIYARPNGRVSTTGVPGPVIVTNLRVYNNAKVNDQTGGLLTSTNDFDLTALLPSNVGSL